MAEHLKFERFFWFDRQVRLERYPNAHTLARQFELSDKTAQRTIDFMEERLGAPLEYDPSRRGYRYTDGSFSLPALDVSQNEMLAVLLAQNLLASAASGVISRSFRSFGRKLFAATGYMGLSEERVGDSFSAVWHGYTPAEAETFRTVADALIRNRCLSFRYFAPSKDELSERRVEPCHLQHYMGSWVLLAWCRDRRDWRKFFLGRMDRVELSPDTFTPRRPEEWEGQLRGAFGIFQGGEPQQVVLRFNPYRARWLRDELWHADQEIEERSDGSLVMRFVVTDFREVKLRILQYGADVEVVEPFELREEVEAEIGRMVELYGAGKKNFQGGH